MESGGADLASRSILNLRRENQHAETVAGLLGRVAFAGSGAGGAKQPRNRAAAVQNAARASGLDGEDRESAMSGCEIHLVTPEEQQDYGGSPRVWLGIRNGLRRAERMLMH